MLNTHVFSLSLSLHNQFKRRERELMKDLDEKMNESVKVTEKELQVRVSALRNEANQRVEKVEKFKGGEIIA